MFSSYLSIVFIFVGLNFEVEQIFCGDCYSQEKCVCDENPQNISNGIVTADNKTANYTCDVGFHLEHKDNTIYCVKLPSNNITWNYTNLPSCILDENATSTVAHDQDSSESTSEPNPTVDGNATSTVAPDQVLSESTSKPSPTVDENATSTVAPDQVSSESTSEPSPTDSDLSTTTVPNTGLNDRVTGDKSNTVVYVSVPLVVVICVLIGVLVLLWRRRQTNSSQEKVRFVNETGTGAVVSITNNSYSNGNIISTDPATNGNITGSEYAEIELAAGPGDRAQEDQANEYQMIDEVVNETKGSSAQPSSYSHVERKPMSNAGNEYSHFNNKIKEKAVTTDYSKVQSRTEHVVAGPQKQSSESSYDRIGVATASNKRDKCEKRPDLVEPGSKYSQIQSGGATVPKQSAKEEVDEYSHLDYKQSTAKSDASGLITSQDITVRDEPSSNLKLNSSNLRSGGYETPVGVRHEYLELQPTWQNAAEVSKSKTGPGLDMPPQQICDGFLYQFAKDIGSVADTDRILNESEMNSKLEETENKESHDYFVLEKTF